LIRRNVKTKKNFKKIFTVKIQAIAAIMIITTLKAIPIPALWNPADMAIMAMMTRIIMIRMKIK
jgi:hypothetical protein